MESKPSPESRGPNASHVDVIGKEKPDSEAMRDTLVEIIADQATRHVDEVGFKFLLEPYTAGSLAAMAFGLFSAAFGFAPPAAVLTYINQDIGSPNSASALFSVIQTIGTTLGYIFVGRLSEVYGRRWVMIIFTTLGLIGAIACATVRDLNSFIGAGVLIGLATGAQCCYGFLAGELMPNKHKLLGMAIVVTFCLPGTGLGALIARTLVEHASWRWIYYIYIMSSVISLVLYVIFYFPKEAAREFNKWEQTKNLDYVGMFLLIAGLVLFILGIMTGGNPYPWTSGKVLGMLVSGAVCLIALVVYESYLGSRAFMAMYLFKDVRGFSMNCICSAVGGIAYVGVSILWPTQVYFIYGASESWSTLAAMSCTIGLGLWAGMVILGPLWGPFGWPRAILIATNLWFTAFIGALAACNPNNKSFGIAISFLAAMPIGFVEQQTGAIAQLVAPDKDIGTAFGTMGCARVGVGAIGTAILLAILTAKSKSELTAHVIPAALEAGLPQASLEALFTAMFAGTPAAMQSVPGISPAIMAAVGAAQTAAYTAAYKYVYYAAVAFGVVASISAMFLRPISHLLTNHVPKTVDKSDIIIDEKGRAQV